MVAESKSKEPSNSPKIGKILLIGATRIKKYVKSVHSLRMITYGKGY